MDRRRVGIVIPALNEGNTIDAVVTSASRYGVPIVVNDGSHDDTAARASEAGADVVTHPVNRGYDAALNSGFVRASVLGCEYVVTMDADGQHDPTTIGAFIRALDEGAEVVVGVRDRRQRLAEHLFALLARLRWGIRDPLCGMKAYRIGVWKALGHFDSYNSIGTELALFAAAAKKRIVQLPVKTRDRIDHPRFGRRFSANWRILHAMWIGMTQPTKAVTPS